MSKHICIGVYSLVDSNRRTPTARPPILTWIVSRAVEVLDGGHGKIYETDWTTAVVNRFIRDRRAIVQ